MEVNFHSNLLEFGDGSAQLDANRSLFFAAAAKNCYRTGLLKSLFRAIGFSGKYGASPQTLLP